MSPNHPLSNDLPACILDAISLDRIPFLVHHMLHRPMHIWLGLPYRAVSAHIHPSFFLPTVVVRCKDVAYDGPNFENPPAFRLAELVVDGGQGVKVVLIRLGKESKALAAGALISGGLVFGSE